MAGKHREKRQQTQQRQKHAHQYLPYKINKSNLKQQINHRKSWNKNEIDEDKIRVRTNINLLRSSRFRFSLNFLQEVDFTLLPKEFHTFYFLPSQCLPLYPRIHWHTNVNPCVSQCASFLHGLGKHKSLSEMVRRFFLLSMTECTSVRTWRIICLLCHCPNLRSVCSC